jgi:hypothetical protein
MTGHDVIIVGARVAGAATAMLLARQGVRVLVTDRVRFPSDTISSHQVQVPGIARLHRWGLLGRLRAAGTPPTSQVRFDAGDVVLHGRFPACQGIDELYSPRRTVLDTLIVDAAGAEVREQFRVEELTRLARYAPPSPAQRHLLATIAGRPAETDRFLGAFAGVIPVADYFAPSNMLRILGPRGIAQIAASAARGQLRSLLAAALLWLVIGAVAAGQRHDYTHPPANCNQAATIAVTILAGPVNYLGVNPKISCHHLPQPSK